MFAQSSPWSEVMGEPVKPGLMTRMVPESSGAPFTLLSKYVTWYTSVACAQSRDDMASVSDNAIRQAIEVSLICVLLTRSLFLRRGVCVHQKLAPGDNPENSP